MDNKFAEGSVVFALASPEIKLVIRRYVDRVYYCRLQSDPEQKEMIYFERELAQGSTL